LKLLPQRWKINTKGKLILQKSKKQLKFKIQTEEKDKHEEEDKQT